MGFSQQAAERGYQATRKNLLINGCFRIWQRGTSQTSNGYGSSDRFFHGNGGSTKTVSRQSFTLGQTDVPGEPEYYWRTVVTSSAGAANYVFSEQPIESVRATAGRTVTISFWAKADASRNITTEFYQYFGAGGSPSASVTEIGIQKHALTTSWQKFTKTVSIPSISGKTLGTSDTDKLSVGFWFDAGSDWNSRTDTLGQQSGTFDIAQIQVEYGDHATDFEYRPMGEEISLCQRYYCKTFALDTAPADYVGFNGAISAFSADGGYAKTNFVFPVEMRASPTITTYNPGSGGTAGYWRTNSDLASASANGHHITTRQCSVACAGALIGNFINIHCAADAEL